MVRWLTLLGSCVLLLGVTGVAPGRSQSAGPAVEEVRPSQGKSERNWHAFWRHHLGEWTGSWTRYTPSGAVRETFASSRQFTADRSRTAITQVNRYRYADGRLIKKEWTYNISDHSRADGFAHPASRAMRGFALDNGAAAWLIPRIQPNQFAPFELFLMHGLSRHSVGVLYGKDGELLRTASIRETRGPRSETHWTDSIVQVAAWRPDGQWHGQERRINADLSLAPVQSTDWQWDNTTQSNHFFPDGIILRCPETISPGDAFSLQVIWRLNGTMLQTITAHYNENAQLISVIQQTLHPATAQVEQGSLRHPRSST